MTPFSISITTILRVHFYLNLDFSLVSHISLQCRLCCPTYTVLKDYLGNSCFFHGEKGSCSMNWNDGSSQFIAILGSTKQQTTNNNDGFHKKEECSSCTIDDSHNTLFSKHPKLIFKKKIQESELT